MTEEFREETLKHINLVNNYLLFISMMLLNRGKNHDKSKLEDPEKSTFIEYTPKLKSSTYGSDEYKNFLKEMQVALDHHYSNNRHHPECHQKGINDMNLVDIIEMFFDWLAATKRHDNGNIFKSIELNRTRFEYDNQLARIFENTAVMIQNQYFDEIEKFFIPDDSPKVRALVYKSWLQHISLSDPEILSNYTEDERTRAHQVLMSLISLGLG